MELKKKKTFFKEICLIKQQVAKQICKILLDCQKSSRRVSTKLLSSRNFWQRIKKPSKQWLSNLFSPEISHFSCKVIVHIPNPPCNKTTLNQRPESVTADQSLINYKVLGGFRRGAREDRKRGGEVPGYFQGLWFRKKGGEMIIKSFYFPWLFQVFISIFDSWVFIKLKQMRQLLHLAASHFQHQACIFFTLFCQARNQMKLCSLPIALLSISFHRRCRCQDLQNSPTHPYIA